MNNSPPVSTDTIGSRIRSGVAWKAGSQLTLQISRMVVALVLARLLAPEDWGLAAMAVAFSGFVVVFTDNALGTALIQRREVLQQDCATVFWISVGAGALLALLGVALSQPLAHFYGEPEVAALFAALSAGFFVSSLGTTHMALLLREMQFRKLELRQIAVTIVGSVIGIGIAVAGYGAWAIVGQLLAETITSTLLLWVLTPWRPSAGFSIASIRRLGTFAGNVFGENVVYQAGRSLSGVLVGRLLGASPLGVYTLATNVILVPFARLAAPLQQVFFPAFSRMSHDRGRIADVWIRATRLVGFFSIPALVGLAIVAPEFVDVVLGPSWGEAIPVIRILAVVGILLSLQTLSTEVMQALGKVATLLRITLLWATASLAAIAIGTHWGIVGVAACYTAVTVVIEPLRAYVTTRALHISIWRFAGALVGIVQATAIMAAAVLAVREALIAAGTPAAVRLVVAVVFGGGVYLAACLWRAPEITAEFKRISSHRRRARAEGDVLDARL